MKTKLLPIIALACIVTAGCKRPPRPPEQLGPTSRCLSELRMIPEIAYLKKTRGNGSSEAGPDALAGMEIALTFNGLFDTDEHREDDPDEWCSPENGSENLQHLIDALKDHQMPPTVAFVSGERLDRGSAEAWLASGNLMGSLTYSHLKPRKTSVEILLADIVRNDSALKDIWGKRRPSAKYFRFPTLKRIQQDENKQLVNDQLTSLGYKVVPASIYARDVRFAESYCAAEARRDHACLNLIKAEFKSLLLDLTMRARTTAQELTGRDIKHIMLLKATRFTAESLSELLTWYKGMGVKFIPLDEALADPAYSTLDDRGRATSTLLLKRVRRHYRGDTHVD